MYVVLNLFALVQAIGALIGAGGSVVGELSYLRAMQDQRIDAAEKKHLRLIARALRYGMILLLVGSLGLVIADYQFSLPLQPGFTESYWLLMTLIFAIIAASWALSRKRIAFWLGSAAVFTGWWFIAFLTIGRFPSMSYGGSVAFYIVATIIIAGILQYARMLTSRA